MIGRLRECFRMTLRSRPGQVAIGKVSGPPDRGGPGGVVRLGREKSDVNNFFVRAGSFNMRLTLIPPARPRLARPKPMVQRFFQWLARRGPKNKKLLTLSITCCTEMIYTSCHHFRVFSKSRYTWGGKL